jgi:hypothetical protein
VENIEEEGRGYVSNGRKMYSLHLATVLDSLALGQWDV